MVLQMKRIQQQAPDVISMVLVDAIHRDPTTAKCYLLGTYSAIVGQSFPCVWERICVYTALVGGHGPTPIRLVLVDEGGEEEPICAQDTTVTFSSPLVVAELTFTFTKVTFTRPGGYRLQLYCADQLLREFRLHVTEPAAAPRRS